MGSRVRVTERDICEPLRVKGKLEGGSSACCCCWTFPPATSLRLDLAEQFHSLGTADDPHALPVVGRVAAFEQKDGIAEGRHRRDAPAADAPINDMLRAVRVDANDLTDVRERRVDAFPLIERNAPDPSLSSTYNGQCGMTNSRRRV